MNASAVYARLLSLGLPVVRVSEAAAALGQSPVTAAQTLGRLRRAGLVQPLRHGIVWVGPDAIDPWVALDFVAAPYPAYASLYRALSIGGVLSQLPVVHYAVTLGRTRQVTTEAGTFSLHQIAPELFGGFETLPSNAKVAGVEKALFDLAYFGSAPRARLFARPPELELEHPLDREALRGWLNRVASSPRRAQVEARLNALLTRAGRAGVGRKTSRRSVRRSFSGRRA
jgi:hypothetical protein